MTPRENSTFPSETQFERHWTELLIPWSLRMGGRGVYRWIAPHEAMPGMYGLGVRFVEGYAEKTILDDF